MACDWLPVFLETGQAVWEGNWAPLGAIILFSVSVDPLGASIGRDVFQSVIGYLFLAKSGPKASMNVILLLVKSWKSYTMMHQPSLDSAVT